MKDDLIARKVEEFREKFTEPRTVKKQRVLVVDVDEIESFLVSALQEARAAGRSDAMKWLETEVKECRKLFCEEALKIKNDPTMVVLGASGYDTVLRLLRAELEKLEAGGDVAE